MPLTNNRTSFNEAEINEHFGKLLEQIERLKAENASPLGNWRESYSPLEQAAYHLCQCRHLLDSVLRQMTVRNRADSRLIKERHLIPVEQGRSLGA